MYAHIFGNNKIGYELHLTPTPEPVNAIKVERHATKPAAKASARQQGAKAWNY